MSELEIRTQIYLSREQHEALKLRAAERSVSMAQIIREAVSDYIFENQEDDEIFDLDLYLGDPVWQIPELIQGLSPTPITDGSINHDDYLYGPADSEA